MTTIYTRTGDKGETSLADERIPKTDPRLDVLGTIDETQAALGLGRAFAADHSVQNALRQVIRQLASMMASVAAASADKPFDPSAVEEIESTIDTLTEIMPAAFSFEVPGSAVASAQLHMARAIARRCERVMWAYKEELGLSPELPIYMNRVSDLCYVCSRIEGKA